MSIDRSWVFRPARIWSLLELLDHDAEAFCRFSSMIGQILIVLKNKQAPDIEVLIDTLAGLQRESDKIGLVSVSKQLDRIKEKITTTETMADELHALIMELYNRMRDSFEERIFLGIEEKDANFYRQTNPLFGQNVQNKFPSIIDEISEAGKCYALDRSTASAFHSIRCLEAGIRAIARSLIIPDPTRGVERNWGVSLRTINTEIESRWPAKTGRLADDAQLFDGLYGALSGMQNPYRNATMHLDQKYTQEEALHLFEIVKGFITKLANRMDENGLPLA